MKYSELLKENKEIESSLTGDRYEIAVLSNIIVSPLKEILEYTLRTHSINTYVNFGNYDNIVQDSQRLKKSNLVVIFWELSNIFDGLQYKANLMGESEIAELIVKVKSEIDLVLSNLKETSLVLINKFSSLIFNYQNLRKNSFDKIGNKLNDCLQQKLPSNFMVVDIDKVIAKKSITNSVDLRYYYSSKALYTIEFYKEYSNYIKPFVLSASGKSKKAIIFDCDNTLWKNILGEDGFSGIEMSSKTKNGTIFEEVQSFALGLNKKGVLLGICSKNNKQDVDEVLDNHPDMKIRDKDLSIKKVNWEDKVTNLGSIAKELNIGLDSLVFVDDSDFELNLIKEYLPEVKCLKVPEKLYEYPRILRENAGYFFNISGSKEDLTKVQMYNEQVQREELKSSTGRIEDYLKSLDLKITVFIDDKSLISRMSQMTLKTNQFNLTTKRYVEAEIKKIVENDQYKLFAFEARDKVGSYGVTGLCIVRLFLKDYKAEIDSLLMSCRVIGRNLEFAFFRFIAEYLSKLGVQTIESAYRKTPKNEQVRNLYKNLGFDTISSNEYETRCTLDLLQYEHSKINYVKLEYGRES